MRPIQFENGLRGLTFFGCWAKKKFFFVKISVQPFAPIQPFGEKFGCGTPQIVNVKVMLRFVKIDMIDNFLCSGI